MFFLSFYQACYGNKTYYAIPIKETEKLSVFDFDGEEVSRFYGITEKIDKYIIEEKYLTVEKCIEIFNFD